MRVIVSRELTSVCNEKYPPNLKLGGIAGLLKE